MIRKSAYSFVGILSTVLIIVMQLILASWLKYPLIHNPTQYWILLIAILFFISIICLFVFIKKKSDLYFIGILVAFSIPKLIAMCTLKFIPKSDMWTYDFQAKMRLANYSWDYMFKHGWLDIANMAPHVFHISSIYHGLYWITGLDLVIIQLLNITLSAICAYLIYSIVKFYFDNELSVLAGMIFFFMPSNYIYSVLIGAEYIQMFASLVSIYFFIRLLDDKYANTTKRKWLYMVLSLIFLIVAQLIKPNMIIYAIAYLILSVFVLAKKLHQHNIKMESILVATMLFIFTTFSLTANKIDQVFYRMPIANTIVETNYTLATGLNYKSGGMYSYDIINHVEKINHSKVPPETKFKQWNTYLAKKKTDNFNYLKKHHLFPSFIKTKLSVLIDPRFGFKLTYFQYKNYFTKSQLNLKDTYNNTLLVFTVVYQVLLFTAIIISSLYALCILIKSKSKNDSFDIYFLANLLNIGILITSIAVEVQPRYQMSIYVPWILILGSSMSIIEKYKTSYKHNLLGAIIYK